GSAAVPRWPSLSVDNRLVTHDESHGYTAKRSNTSAVVVSASPVRDRQDRSRRAAPGASTWSCPWRKLEQPFAWLWRRRAVRRVEGFVGHRGPRLRAID